MAPSVAVIIPTYNKPDVLARVLEAYDRQTKLADELIVADDGSGDSTRKLVQNWAAKSGYPIKHVWQEDVGYRLAKIRNEAVKATDVEYLIMTDGDCIPHPRFVEDHLRLAQEGFFVQGKRMHVGPRLAATFAWPGYARLILHCLKGEVSGGHHLPRIPWLARCSHRLKGIKTANLAVFREDFIAVNGFNEEFVGWGREDTEFVSRLFRYGLRRKDAPFSALVFHLWHEPTSRDSLTRNDHLLDVAGQSMDYFCQTGMRKVT